MGLHEKQSRNAQPGARWKPTHLLQDPLCGECNWNVRQRVVSIPRRRNSRDPQVVTLVVGSTCIVSRSVPSCVGCDLYHSVPYNITFNQSKKLFHTSTINYNNTFSILKLQSNL